MARVNDMLVFGGLLSIRALQSSLERKVEAHRRCWSLKGEKVYLGIDQLTGACKDGLVRAVAAVESKNSLGKVIYSTCKKLHALFISSASNEIGSSHTDTSLSRCDRD